MFYVAPIALTEGTVCDLPKGSEFNSAVKTFLNSNSSLTQIEFIANSSTTGTQIGSSTAYLVAGSDNTLEIHANADVFVFNTDCEKMFENLSTITSIDFNNSVNTANVTNMEGMFYNCLALTSLDVSNFNTANVTNMGSMFRVCSALTSLDVSNFNTANVTDMGSMFERCCTLTSLDLSNFNTANVTKMVSMFYYCSALTSLDLSSFDFSKVTSFSNTFKDLGSTATNKPIPVYVKDAATKTLLEENTTGINSEYAIIKLK